MNLQSLLPRRLVTSIRVAQAMGARMGQINIGLISAGVAFYGLLAVFPTMAAVVAIWGLFADPAAVAAQVQQLEPMVPDDGFAILDQQVQALASGASSTLGWASAISLLAALWASRSGVAAIIGGLNTVHDSRSRGGILHAIVALALSLTMILAALVALASVVIAPVALAFLPLGPFTNVALDLLRWIVGIGVVLFAVGLLYRFGPYHVALRPVWRRAGVVTPGVILAVALWGVVSLGFSTYLANFGSYDRVYGSLGAVIALLMWLYLSGFTVLLGAIFDVEYARGRAEAGSAPGPAAGEGAARTLPGAQNDGAENDAAGDAEDAAREDDRPPEADEDAPDREEDAPPR